MKIEESVKKLETQIKIDKDFLWNHPEGGNKELKTSQYISERLKEMGYQVKSNIGTTGILAQVEGKQEGPCVLFRSELDALEMDTNGRMKHTCGHDAHMTVLLALAKLIMENKENLKGTIKLAFEPAAETTGGAKMLIEEGVLENPKVDYIFGIHMWSELKKGTVGIKSGSVMASTDPFDITVYGKEGHGALPERCIDPVYIASSIVTSLQSIVGRNISPLETATVGITSIQGGNNNNLIPEKVEMKGICRTYSNEIREYVKTRIEQIATNIAKSMNGSAEVEFKSYNLPPVINHEETTKLVKVVASHVLEKENIIENYQTMCSDDMAYFLQERPGTFVFVGCTDKEYHPQHSENFFVDTETMLNGTQLLYEIVKKTNLIDINSLLK